jgi:signal transduction histidine kinase
MDEKKPMKIWDRWQVRFSIAPAAAGMGLLLRIAVTQWVGSGFPTYITFYPVVILAALFGGFWPGILATLMSALMVDYWILPPEGMFKYTSAVDLVGQLFFIGMGALMSAVAGRLRFIRSHLEQLVVERTTSLRNEMEERKKAEESVRKSADDLARSNKDLEQFAYVASHDLQEPLRAVAGFMGLLKKQYHASLPGEASEYIDYAIEGAERMQTLIEGLLAYSRVGRKETTFSSFNMNEAVDGALLNLQTAVAESGASIIRGDMPFVNADLLQMTQLMQNLIGNSLKFHGQGRPEIFIGSEKKDGKLIFSVRDNGIGIDPKYFDRIFMIFQRLHTRDKYKGTGIGLALCKKIVERHGGSIWVESKPNEGSTFYFSIPSGGQNP